ncbi:mechanosensitive ion channel family protein [Oleidesulfovibrio alaskensis]|jgi:small conductance mechanosensitive channel|uniref:mechanosensitive ion channel family protein n=1 Tax=Oleidesulfovibrio alaskensis TaxID=58180 RepID=UPI001A402F61|nr:mechanosensitive ion channel domain-containing protein [Oleidesulfovibrio alaskensis]MBL3581845.1 mechanosensitive ion channel [Oleidesulfovibrio alaskensis]
MDYARLMEEYGDMIIVWLARNGTNLLVALVIAFAGAWLCGRVANLVRKGMELRGIDRLLTGFIRNVIYYVLLVAVLIAAAGQLGIDTTSFLALLGSMGLAVGLAIKDNLANFSSGIMLILFRPFTLGDYVTVAGVSGTVDKLSLSTTLLLTPDNQRIIVPNSKIMSDVIVNVTGNPTRRMDLTFGVGYGDDLALAKKVIEDVVRAQPELLTEPPCTIAVAELGDSSVNLVVRPWVATADYWTVRFRLIEEVKKALDANGISIPYPQRDVHIVQAADQAAGHGV